MRLAHVNTLIPRPSGTQGDLRAKAKTDAKRARRAIHQALAATKEGKATAATGPPLPNVQPRQIGASFVRSISKANVKKGKNCPLHHNGRCRFHTAGTCTKGDKCVFTHWNSNPGEAMPAVDPTFADGKVLIGKAAKAAAKKAKGE